MIANLTKLTCLGGEFSHSGRRNKRINSERKLRERHGTSHGLSMRVAWGVYYRPGTFRSRNVKWDETVHADTGLLGFTTKHIYFSGPSKKFRVRYDRIVNLEPFADGFGIMPDAQTAKPQSFRTGDGWFAYYLAVNLA